MISVDLNCDLGESFGAYTIGMDEAVIPLITSANVACGYHAGIDTILVLSGETTHSDYLAQHEVHADWIFPSIRELCDAL